MIKLDLTDRVAVVTGGGRGIGRAISMTLAAAGATVVVNYNSNATAAEEVVATIEADGGTALAVQANVAEGADVTRLFKTVLDSYKRLDILVNNAGIGETTLIMRMREEDFDRVLDTNLRSVYLCTRAALRTLTRQRSGRIINMTSVLGLIGSAGQAHYTASKAGIIGFTRSAAVEVAKAGITVNAVAPGFIKTDMTSETNDAYRKQILELIPMGREGEPEEIAGLVGFLASDDASYITGVTITVDGGLMMH